MKIGKTMEDFASTLLDIERNKFDVFAPSTSIRPVANGDLQLEVPNPRDGGLSRFGLNNLAHGQLANALNIPKQHYDRMRTEAPELLAHSVSVWLSKHVDTKGRIKTKLVRTLNGTIRAILSDAYRPLDCDDLAKAALPTMQGLDLTFESLEITERKMYIKATHPTLQGEVKVGTIMAAGVIISNSDVGCGSVICSQFYKELRCTNGWVVERTTNKRHLGTKTQLDDSESSREFLSDEARRAKDKAFFLEFRDTVADMFNRDKFEKGLDKFRLAAGQPVTASPVEVVEWVQDKYRFTEAEKDNVLNHFIQRGDLSKLGLGAAITRTAEDLDDYDRATEFEATGTKLIEMPRNEWESKALTTAVTCAV